MDKDDPYCGKKSYEIVEPTLLDYATFNPQIRQITLTNVRVGLEGSYTLKIRVSLEDYPEVVKIDQDFPVKVYI